MQFNTSLLDIINSSTKLKVVQFLLKYNTTMSEREMASIIKISHMNINRTMRELSKINLIDYSTIGKAHAWRINKKSYAYKILSKFINSFSVFTKPLDDLKKTILLNLPTKIVREVILFGSVAKGSEEFNSDIDLFILLKFSKNKEILETYINKLSSICLEKYGNRLAPYILTEKEYREKRNLKIISELNRGEKLFPLRSS